MIIDVTADINDFLDVEADIATSADDDHTSQTCARVAGVLLEAKLIWLENLDKTPLSERSETPEPDLMGIDNIKLRDKLNNLRRREQPRAFNFNLNTGRIRR